MLGEVILLAILILINGVFASSEIAFLSFDKYILREDLKSKNKSKLNKAKKVKKLINEPSIFLATIQIGITLAGFLASAFAADSFANIIVQAPIFATIGYNVAKPIVVVIVTIILSYFTLIFGELVPKRLALACPEKIAYATVNLITIIMKVTYPFVWILTKSTNVVSKLLGIKKEDEEKITEEEIKKIIITGKEEGAIESIEKKLIFNIFDFNDTIVKKVMTKKNKMVMVDIDSSEKEIIKVVKECKFTRIPVYKEDRNNIVGILNVKDLVFHYSKNTKIDIKKILYTPIFINSSDKIDDIFRMMQRKRQGIAIVRDEDIIVGLVTLEDAIEEVLGNIYDEHDN